MKHTTWEIQSSDDFHNLPSIKFARMMAAGMVILFIIISLI